LDLARHRVGLALQFTDGPAALLNMDAVVQHLLQDDSRAPRSVQHGVRTAERTSAAEAKVAETIAAFKHPLTFGNIAGRHGPYTLGFAIPLRNRRRLKGLLPHASG
jgi:hypothetical protein